jgi:hypothetical protein
MKTSAHLHLQNLLSEVFIVLNSRADLFMFFSHTKEKIQTQLMKMLKR